MQLPYYPNGIHDTGVPPVTLPYNHGHASCVPPCQAARMTQLQSLKLLGCQWEVLEPGWVGRGGKGARGTGHAGSAVMYRQVCSQWSWVTWASEAGLPVFARGTEPVWKGKIWPDAKAGGWGPPPTPPMLLVSTHPPTANQHAPIPVLPPHPPRATPSQAPAGRPARHVPLPGAPGAGGLPRAHGHAAGGAAAGGARGGAGAGGRRAAAAFQSPGRGRGRCRPRLRLAAAAALPDAARRAAADGGGAEGGG